VRQLVAAFLSGLVFAGGLALAGMTRPAKVVAFLDFAGAWDPSLAFVMVGAILVYALALRPVLKMRSPVLAALFDLPATEHVDRRLIGGAIIFGIGWGISGFCPGPAIVSLVTGAVPVMVFVVAMAGGVLLSRLVDGARS
jgi:uncharacterized membrane protein YedE/YeeE